MNDICTKLRAPNQVMRLSRLGSLHQCRLSFMRQLTRRMARENWTFSRPVFEVDERGEGHAVYVASGPDRAYSLVAFAHDLPDEMRTDRVIAEAWDATFALFDGVPNAEDIERLQANVPLQEAGRVSESELSLSRANRSVRLWSHVLERLAKGEQPEIEQIAAVGYLMRTTAVYGSGKFGSADREKISMREEMRAPFQAEMLSVYLTRAFARDLIEHMALSKGGEKAVRLDEDMAVSLGIGNSTGLGMAPFLVNHPILLNNWIKARESALALVLDLEHAQEEEIASFLDFVKKSETAIDQLSSEHPMQVEKNKALKADWKKLISHLEKLDLSEDFAWQKLFNWAENAFSEEGQELLASLLLEPYGALVDMQSDEMSDDSSHICLIDGARLVAEMVKEIEAEFAWALQIDWEKKENIARAWYVSEEKLEPRLGERFEEPIEDYEQPLATARDIARAYRALKDWDQNDDLANFLSENPEHRHSIRRVFIREIAPYGEIVDNTISAELLPIDMLRAKLSFFGATSFDPRSDRWVRISMYGGAPYPEALDAQNSDFWVYPEAKP